MFGTVLAAGNHARDHRSYGNLGTYKVCIRAAGWLTWVGHAWFGSLDELPYSAKMRLVRLSVLAWTHTSWRVGFVAWGR